MCDGSVLTITEVKFEPNYSGSVRRDTCRFSRSVDLEGPSLGVLGKWHGRGKPTHSFRFVTAGRGRICHFDSEEPDGGLRPASAQDCSPTQRIHLAWLCAWAFSRRFGEESARSAVSVKNHLLIKECSSNTKAWSVRQIDLHHWRVGTRQFLRNSDGPDGRLVEKLYSFGQSASPEFDPRR